jgi:MFS family permease
MASTARTPTKLWPFQKIYYGWAIVWSSAVIAIAQTPMFGPVLSAFVKPISDDLGWSRATISLAFTIGTLTGSVASLAVGRILDRHGARVVIVIAGLLIAGSLLGLATMTEPWHFWTFFGIGRGAAIAGIQMGTTVAIANWFVRKRARAAAITSAGLRFGQAIVPLLIIPILIAFNWRIAFGSLSIFAVILILVPSIIYIRRRPEDFGMKPDGEQPDEEPIIENENQSIGSLRLTISDNEWSLKEALRTKSLWLTVTGMTISMFTIPSMNLHAVANFQDHGMAQTLATTVIVIFAGTAAVASFGWGILMDRIHVRFGLALVFVIFAMSTVMIMLWVDTYVQAVLFALVFGIAVGGISVGERIIWANYFGRRSVGSIKGFSMLFVGTIGPTGPVLTGFLRDQTGDYNLAFLVLLGAAGAGLAAMICALPPKRKKG